MFPIIFYIKLLYFTLTCINKTQRLIKILILRSRLLLISHQMQKPNNNNSPFIPQQKHMPLSKQEVSKLLTGNFITQKLQKQEQSQCKSHCQCIFLEDFQNYWEDQKNVIQDFELDEKQLGRVKRGVGVIISKYPKQNNKCKHRIKNLEGIKTHGTAFLIGKNLLLTVAHNVCQRKPKSKAQQVFFLPQIFNNEKDQQKILRVKSFQVFPNYLNPKIKSYSKYDIALVTLQQHNYQKDLQIFDIDWNFWNQNNLVENAYLFGYPNSLRKQTNQFKLRYEKKSIIRTDEALHYKDTECGQSGGPHIIFIEQQGRYSIKIVGLHQRRIGFNSFGICLNAEQNTQQMVFQLAQKLEVQNFIGSYQHSNEKMKNLLRQINFPYMSNPMRELIRLQQQNQKLQQQLRRCRYETKRLQSRCKRLQKVQSEYKKLLNELDSKKIHKMQNQQLPIEPLAIQTSNSHKTFSNFKSTYQQLNFSTINPIKNEQFQLLKIQLRKHLQVNMPIYYKRQFSKKQVEQTMSQYLNRFDKLQYLPSQHNEQLLFLIKYFNKNNLLITNYYGISMKHKDQKTRIGLDFDYIRGSHVNQLYLKVMLSYGDWNHLIVLSFNYAGWFDDDYWKTLNQNAKILGNLKCLGLQGNKITNILSAEILSFKSVKEIYLKNNTLNEGTKNILSGIKGIRIDY